MNKWCIYCGKYVDATEIEAHTGPCRTVYAQHYGAPLINADHAERLCDTDQLEIYFNSRLEGARSSVDAMDIRWRDELLAEMRV